MRARGFLNKQNRGKRRRSRDTGAAVAKWQMRTRTTENRIKNDRQIWRIASQRENRNVGRKIAAATVYYNIKYA